MAKAPASTLPGRSPFVESALNGLYGQIDSLPREDQPDEDGDCATSAAVERTRDLLAGTAELLASPERKTPDAASVFQSGFVTTDGRGGVRVEWWRGKHSCVHLVTGAARGSAEHVFFKFGEHDPGNLERAVQTDLLASRLERLSTCPGESA